MPQSTTIPPERVMSILTATFRGSLFAIFCWALVVIPAAAASDKDNKPSIAIKSSPVTGFAPFRVVLTVDVKGGPDDYEQYYCATAEWDMGDGNKAEQAVDCDPYEAGKSQIKRRYVREQIFDTPG